MDIEAWLKEQNGGRRVTISDLAKILGVTRKTVRTRIDTGMPLDDLITICRALNIRPVDALVDQGIVTHQEVLDWIDSDGSLVATASDGDLAKELAERLNPNMKMRPAHWGRHVPYPADDYELAGSDQPDEDDETHA